MIFWLNLEKVFLKLTQNLTLQLPFNGLLFSGKVASSCPWWHTLFASFSTLSVFSVSLNVLNLFISRVSRTLSFIHVWHYGHCSRLNPVELSMTLFGVLSSTGWFPITFYAVLLMFNATCQYFFLCLAIIFIIAWAIELVHSRMTIR